MKILFIYPPPFEDKILSKLVYPPLGIMFLASVVRDMNHEVRIFDGNVQQADLKQTLDYIKEFNPNIIGITAATPNIANAFKLASEVKKINENIKIILGGPHPTVAPKNCLDNKFIDFILIGEGESTIKELIGCMESNGDFSKINGIGFLKEGKAVITPKRELIKDINALLMPAYDLIPIEKYWCPQITEFPFTSMITSRGCPYQCIFCGVQAIFGHEYRFMSPENIIAQIEILQEKYGIKTIIFKDSEFALRKNRIEKFCDLIIEKGIKVKWLCNGRINNMTKELLMKMKNAGCFSITYGVESGSDRILTVLKKNISLEQARKTIYLTKEAGIEAVANFIIGNPTETKEDIETTINFAIELDTDYATFSNMVPFPGTEIYDMALKNKWVHSVDIETYKNDSVVMNATELDTKELKKYLKKAYLRFYIRPKFIFKKLKNFKFSDINTKIPVFIDILKQ